MLMGVEKTQTDCVDCSEGCVLGKRVYCSIDGRFHPMRDNSVCRSFIPRKDKQ